MVTDPLHVEALDERSFLVVVITHMMEAQQALRRPRLRVSGAREAVLQRVNADLVRALRTGSRGGSAPVDTARHVVTAGMQALVDIVASGLVSARDVDEPPYALRAIAGLTRGFAAVFEPQLAAAAPPDLARLLEEADTGARGFLLRPDVAVSVAGEMGADCPELLVLIALGAPIDMSRGGKLASLVVPGRSPPTAVAQRMRRLLRYAPLQLAQALGHPTRDWASRTVPLLLDASFPMAAERFKGLKTAALAATLQRLAAAVAAHIQLIQRVPHAAVAAYARKALQRPIPIARGGASGPQTLVVLANAGTDKAAVTRGGARFWLDSDLALHRAGGQPAVVTADGHRVWFSHGVHTHTATVGVDAATSGATLRFAWTQYGGTCYAATALNILTCCRVFRDGLTRWVAMMHAIPRYAATIADAERQASSVAAYPAADPPPSAPGFLGVLAFMFAFRLCGRGNDATPVQVPPLVNALEQAVHAFAGGPVGQGGQPSVVLAMLLYCLRIRAAVRRPGATGAEPLSRPLPPGFQGVVILADANGALADTLFRGSAAELRLVGCMLTTDTHAVAGLMDERAGDDPVVFDSADGATMHFDWRLPLQALGPKLGASAWYQRQAVYVTASLARDVDKPMRCSAKPTAAALSSFKRDVADAEAATANLRQVLAAINDLFFGETFSVMTRRPVTTYEAAVASALEDLSPMPAPPPRK
jgi:hypothetical protein